MADVSMISGVLFLIIKSTLCSKKVWSEIPTIRNHLPKSSFNVTTTRSSLECAEYSQQMDSCLAFSYNKVTQTCSPLDDLRQRQYEESTYVWYLYVTDCDTGWKQSEEFCYLVVDIPKTWQDASAHCAILSSHLVMIPTEKVDIFIRNTLNQIHALDDITSINYWSDGTDAGQEGQWKWASSGTPIGYTNWAPLEPSHAPEDCLAICGVKGFKWNDDICVRTHPFICERNRKLPVPDL